MQRQLTFSFLLTLLFSLSAFGGTTGKIAGRVTEVGSNNPLVGANVVVVGTLLGASTDVDGYYSIINVPPGVYTVRVSLIGYQTVQETQVAVNVDRTTPLNPGLRASAVDMDVVEVVAKRPEIVHDRTASLQKVGAAEIEKLPVENVNDLIRLQAGVTQSEGGGLHMRGGRGSEVGYYIDGMAVSNPFGGGMAVDVQNSSIQEIQVISGAFNAEYGQAMSGIVNIVTKDPGDRLASTVSLETGDFLSNRENMFMNIKSINPLSQRYFDGSISGPVPLLDNKVHFFLSARYRNEENWLYGQRKYIPTDTTNFSSANPADWTLTSSGDNAYVPMNPAEDLTLQAKLTFRVMDNLKMTYNGLWDKSNFKPYATANSRFGSHWNMYNPGYVRTNYTNGLNNLVTFTHTLSPSVYHELKLTYYTTDLKVKPRESLTDPDLVSSVRKYTALPTNMFSVGSIDPRFEYRKTYTMAAKYEITAQVDRYNLFKVGAEYRRHKLQYEYLELLRDETTNWQLATTDVNARTHNYYSKDPLELAGYVQDKIEIEDMIVNAGVRFDYFNAKSKYPLLSNDPANKLGAPLDVAYANASVKMQVSPRLGLAFPISDKGNIHASYGQFFQIPDYDQLYDNPEYEIFGKFETYIGNANLEAQRTTVYEIGLQQMVAPNLVLDATCYYKDIRNLSGAVLAKTFDQDEYGQYANNDYGHVWGITLSLDVLKTGLLSGRVNYTYQVAEGNGSDPLQAYHDAYNNNEAAKSLVPLNWDQRHVLNAELAVDGDDWGVSSINNFGSGSPYTPGTTYIPIANVQLTNEARWKPQYNMDLRAYKNFTAFGVTTTLFASIENVFDRSRQERLPYLSDRDLATHAPKARFNTLYDFRYDPGFQPTPRLVKVGLRVKV